MLQLWAAVTAVSVAVHAFGEGRRQNDMAVLQYSDPLLWLQQQPECHLGCSQYAPLWLASVHVQIASSSAIIVALIQAGRVARESSASAMPQRACIDHLQLGTPAAS